MSLFDAARSLELPPTQVAEAAWDLAKRRRKRRRRLQSAAVAAVAVGVVGAYFAYATTSSDHPLPPATPTDLACTSEQDPLKLQFPTEGSLQSGATAALVCPTNGANWQPPAEPLEQDLDQLVSLINSRPEQVIGLGRCLGQRDQTDYSITFAYPDGTTSAVWGDPGCSDSLRAGGEPRSGGALVLGTYLESLVSQRAEHAPPPTARAVKCPKEDGGLTRSILPSTTRLDIDHAFVCHYRWTRVAPGAFAFVLQRSAPLAAAQIEHLNEAFAANARPIEPDYEVGDELDTITAVTQWGDHKSLELLNGELVLGPAPAQQNSQSLAWRMPPTDRASLFGR